MAHPNEFNAFNYKAFNYLKASSHSLPQINIPFSYKNKHIFSGAEFFTSPKKSANPNLPCRKIGKLKKK